MPPPQGRAGSVWVYLISCLLFLVLVSGGVLLLLYIILPESEGTAWFPIAGLVLVGIPWVFWILTCLYRTVTPRDADTGVEKWVPARTASVAPAAGCGSTKPEMDDDQPATTPVQVGTEVAPGSAAGNGGATSGAIAANESNEGSSLASRESEIPLALSMS